VRELATVQTQMNKLRQGLARLIDGYAEGLIDKEEFTPRIARQRQRLDHLETQAQQLTDALAEQQDLRLVVGQLETFAAQVRQGLETADWGTRRELIQALVKRVEIEQGQVRVVFRVPPNPPAGGAASREEEVLPDRRSRKRTALGGALRRVRQRATVEDPGGQDGPDEPQDPSVTDPLRETLQNAIVPEPVEGRPDTLPTSRTFRRRCAFVASTIPCSGNSCLSTGGCVVTAGWTSSWSCPTAPSPLCRPAGQISTRG
jgi:site-specific DNA recombinase